MEKYLKMNTHVLHINPLQLDIEKITLAAACIQQGGLVAFPTETVYGLGANALDEAAVQKIFVAKERPSTDPLIVHIAELSQLDIVAINIPMLAYQLVEAFWPGPLTFVLPKHAQIPPNVCAHQDTVAVRMPSHPIAKALLTAANVPIAAPSANRFSRPSATTAQHVFLDLDGRIDFIIDGGTTEIGLESTVLDLTQTPPVILRPGGVTVEALRNFMPDVQFKSVHLRLEDTPAAPSPGMLSKHYSPSASLYLFIGHPERLLTQMHETAQQWMADGKKVGVLLAEEDAPRFASLSVEAIFLGRQANLQQIGYNLFAALRELDNRGVDVILVHEFERDGLGLAVWDRLLRAADGQIIRVE